MNKLCCVNQLEQEHTCECGYSHVMCTRIKIESSNQIKPFLRADQGIKVTSELRQSKDQDMRLQSDLWPATKSRDLELQKGGSSNQAQFLLIKNFDPYHKAFNRQQISDYPLEKNAMLAVKLIPQLLATVDRKYIVVFSVVWHLPLLWLVSFWTCSWLANLKNTWCPSSHGTNWSCLHYYRCLLAPRRTWSTSSATYPARPSILWWSTEMVGRNICQGEH